MTLERFEEIVKAYGAASDSWPIDEREAALTFLENNSQAQVLLKNETSLDLMLDELSFEVPNISLLNRNIMEKLESEKLDLSEKILDWILPRKPISIWQPALAAALPVLVGILFGMQIESLSLEEEWDKEFYLNAFSTSIDNSGEGKVSEESQSSEPKEVKHG